MNSSRFEEIEHTADWAIAVHGETLEALFENAAEGMFSLLDAKVEDQETAKKELDLSAIDQETLLVSWLEELLFLLESEQYASGDFDVEIQGDKLAAEFTLYPIRSINKDIKAVTYNELEIVKDEEGFHTTIVFDV